MRLILEEQQKYLQSFINNVTYHPMNADADVTKWTVNFLVLANVLSTSFLMVHFTFDEISTTVAVYTILVKIDVLDTCGTMIMFVLWNHISAIFYEDRKHCLRIFPKQHAFVH